MAPKGQKRKAEEAEGEAPEGEEVAAEAKGDEELEEISEGEDDEDEEEEDDEDEEEEEEDEDEVEEEVDEEATKAEAANAKAKAAPKGKAAAKAKGKAAAKGKGKGKGKGKAKRRKTDASEEEAEDDEEAKGEDAEEAGEGEPEEELSQEELAAKKLAEAQERLAAAEKKLEVVVEEQEGPRKRLMIQKIVLENFKSYGGVKTIGPFHKSFSSIVGPNGSGKSNTIDALLFVFGKRAKQMRLRKVSELIHGSSTMMNCGFAKVEVVFQDIIDTGEGAEDYEIVEGSQLRVSRIAFKNNTSKYFLDDKPSNFTEVTSLLRKRGVDLEHNRFLILQGEVEQISLMKPKALTPHDDGLLEYLEDIIGSNRLVEPIEQAEQIIEQLTETRQERLNRLRVAEREKESLDGPRKEAEAWVSAEGERLELIALAAQEEARRCHAGTVKLEQEHKVLQGHMDEHKKKMEGFEAQVKEIETEHNAKLKDYNVVKEKIEKAAAEFKEFERLDVKFTEDIQFHEQKLKKLVEAEQKERESAKQLVQDAEKLKNDAPTREKELDAAERHKAAVVGKLEKVYDSLKGKAERLRPLKEKKEAELVPLQQRLSDVRKVVEVAQVEANMIREKTSKISDEIEEVKKHHFECAQRLKVNEQQAKEVKDLKKERLDLTKEAKSRLSTVTAQVDEVSKEVQTTRMKAEEARASFQEEHHRGRLIRAVYEMSKAGKLKGVHGRLGDLGAIAKKYDVAVSTACGMLDAIVVDTTEDAQELINFVRQQDLGRTTCICLQKIKDREAQMEQRPQIPDGAERLFDLIKPAKAEYKVAFFFALGNTLVSPNLDQATKIALQGRTRNRVVTLDGKLIDTSGTMSGGGNQVAKGGMRASLCMHSPEEVKALGDAYEKAASTLAQIREEKRQLEEALQMTEKEIAELDIRERKVQVEIASLKKQMEDCDARLKALKVPQLSGDEKKRLKELEKLISSRSGELNKIQQEHQEVETEVRNLHEQIMNIGGEELREAKAKVEEATKKCEDMRRFMKKALLDVENMAKAAKKAEAAAKAAHAELATTEKALAKLKEEHAKIDDKAEAVLEAYNALKEKLTEHDGLLSGLRTKRDQVMHEASALKSQEVDLVNEMEEKTRVLKELYNRIQAWGAKLTEARAEYKQLPLDILADLRKQAKKKPTSEDAGEEEEEDETEVKEEETMGQKAIRTELDEPELKKVKRSEVDARLTTLEASLKNLKPNLQSIEEFRRADTEYKTKSAEYEAVHSQREEARRKLESLRQQRLEEFMEGFSVISMKLKEMYQMITLGGDAELELVDTLDPFAEGINFSVRPPKKSWKQITNLSGGEKTLASLSLVFALHHYKPTPLYFMDEIDAALDFRNVSIIANYVKERTKNAQFIVISLRNHMFEMADLLVGIYKTQDVSKSVAINPTAFDVPRPPATPQGALTAGKMPQGVLEGPPAKMARIGA
eukprot:TRINITY_DN16790_c0_g1_i1.p1 TRINITY_DN16790_c0_g1~~TRINITY_DN16790_c0_g1_i1.p1  ORF type:complete len:1458 (+),score=653.66 TRINITY_DN16790_c0_g1_i1:138-4511(+)